MADFPQEPRCTWAAQRWGIELRGPNNDCGGFIKPGRCRTALIAERRGKLA